MTYIDTLFSLLDRIAVTMERMAPQNDQIPEFSAASAFVWHPSPARFSPVPKVSHVPLKLLLGIEPQRDALLANTQRFANGLPANNALLWGARGAGKSSLIKAIHAELTSSLPETAAALKLVEIHREDIGSLPECLSYLASQQDRFIIFCDDLSFDDDDTSYKSLKAVLEGGIEGRPENVLFYATSNRRHLLSRTMMENQYSTAINPSDDTNEKISLSDRFGLWIGFHNCSQSDYLAIVDGYVAHFGLEIEKDQRDREALEWARTRGARSGRVAWQFIQDLAGRMGKKLN